MAIVKTTSTVNGEEVDIYIQVDDEYKPAEDDDPFNKSRGAKDVIDAGKDLFGEGLALTHVCAAKVIERVGKMSDAVKPNEFSIDIGIVLDTEAGVPMLAKAGIDVQMNVTMTWKLKADPEN